VDRGRRAARSAARRDRRRRDAVGCARRRASRGCGARDRRHARARRVRSRRYRRHVGRARPLRRVGVRRAAHRPPHVALSATRCASSRGSCGR
jgi:hypothetical protein